MSIQRVSSFSSSHWEYDVFLSFRGMDTRKNFIDHLYAALDQKGIYVFRDDKELERGKPISPELLEAIEESRSSIVVFSRNYASSSWCLDEIVKIVECKNTKGQNVIPIFYDVTPSVVRNQTGVFREAFAQHEEKFKEDNKKIQKWRNALKEIANLSGWEAENWYESELIKDIVQELSTKLGRTIIMNFEGLIGISSRLEELKSLIDIESNDVLKIGIWGMGGIGKTTIARVFYDLVSNQFQGSCFLANVREISEKTGLVTLQRQLLSEILKGQETNIYDEYGGANKIKNRFRHKKVLIVIDDVACIEQLNKLAEKHDWFGLGSRIIITTRDKHLLLSHGVDKVYEAKELNHDEALQLLILKAFRNHQPSEDYKKLSELVISYAGGLPLALEVLGSFLFGRSIDEWKDAIERLERDSNKEILDKLEISFDALEETEKKIFLDVACFFKGENREYATWILDGCSFNPTIGIKVLLDKSLITISNVNQLWMHDLLQQMGRRIVKRESLEEPGKRSRLWDEEDIRHVLTKNTGTKLVEAMILEKERHLSVGAKVFSKMINLRMLKIREVQLPKGLEYLSNELRLLDWNGYSLKSLPSNFQLDKLVEFKMDCSCIRQPWKGIKCLNMLKSISFKDCKNLTKTPDFTGIPNLEKLTLKRCSRLSEIHPSLLVHKKLKWINLKDCSSLMTLPSKIHMESLERLVLSGCSKLKKFPEIMGSMEYLWGLFLEETAIKELPLSVGLLAGLEKLNLEECKNLVNLPSTIDGLKSLKTLSISHCFELVSLPSTIDGLRSLDTLSISHCPKLVSLPSTIDGLKSLETLNLIKCTKLVSLPDTINGLQSLVTLNLSGCSRLENVPETLGQVESLSILKLRFTAIRQPVSSIFFMKNLSELDFCGCEEPKSKSFLKKSLNPSAFALPCLSGNLCSVKKLDLSFCNLGEGAIPSDFLGSLVSLQELDLSRNNFVSLPTTINRLSNLRVLRLKYCCSLQILPELPSCIDQLLLDGCISLETLPNALRLCDWGELEISCQYCVELLNSSRVAFSMLKEYLKREPRNGRHKFSMVVPGSEVPEWFKHKREGASIKIEKPPYLYNNSKLVGYIVCCVFFVHKQSPRTAGQDLFGMNVATCIVTSDFSIDDPFQYFLDMSLSCIHYIVGLPVLDHLWLLYLPHDEMIKGNNPNFSISSMLDRELLVVNRCGVHPVYEQEDFEDFVG